MRDSSEEETVLEQSASVVNGQFGGEGEYVDDICNQPEFERLTKLIEDATLSAKTGVSKPSIRGQVLAKLQSLSDLVKHQSKEKGGLKKGKRKEMASISKENVIEGKRKPNNTTLSEMLDSSSSSSEPPLPKPSLNNVGRPANIKKGDIVSLPATAFDGDDPGSFSQDHPDVCVGQVVSVNTQGLAKVK